MAREKLLKKLLSAALLGAIVKIFLEKAVLNTFFGISEASVTMAVLSSIIIVLIVEVMHE